VEPKRVFGGAFGQYMAEHRPALLKECPGKPATAALKLGSERFKALGASAAKYEKMHADAKAQYDKDLAAFLAAGGVRKDNKEKNKAKREKKAKKLEKLLKKDPNKPKQPAGGAFGYLAKHREELMKECAGKPITAVTKLASERWKQLSTTARAPYQKEFEEKKAAYVKAMQDYVPPVVEKAEDGNDEHDEEGGKKRKAGTKEDKPAAKKGKIEAIASDVAAEAKKLGYLVKLKGLCENPKVEASPSEILGALQKEQGSVVAAKKALLGA